MPFFGLILTLILIFVGSVVLCRGWTSCFVGGSFLRQAFDCNNYLSTNALSLYLDDSRLTALLLCFLPFRSVILTLLKIPP